MRHMCVPEALESDNVVAVDVVSAPACEGASWKLEVGYACGLVVYHSHISKRKTNLIWDFDLGDWLPLNTSSRRVCRIDGLIFALPRECTHMYRFRG